jgi:hypothetical protein
LARIERATIFVIDKAQRARAAFGSAASQPLAVRIFLLLVAFAIAIPLAALIFITGIVGVAVLIVYLATKRVLNTVRKFLPRNDGRENVRVIRTRG